MKKQEEKRPNLEKVVVSRVYANLCIMQVCAEKDLTDEEILAICNRDNPIGTPRRWTTVIREVEYVLDADGTIGDKKIALPAQCEDYPDRNHFLVLC